MNHAKIHSIVAEQQEDLALLQWFLDRGDYRACRDIIRYLYILGQDINRLVDSQKSLSPEAQKPLSFTESLTVSPDTVGVCDPLPDSELSNH